MAVSVLGDGGGHTGLASPQGGLHPWRREAAAVEAAETIALRLGMQPVVVREGYKTLYHAAAVSVAGHVTALFAQAMEAMCLAGFEPESARDALLPLMRGALDNLALGLPSEVATGPIVRGDAETVACHLAALEAALPAVAAVYRRLARQALDMARPTLDHGQVTALERVLGNDAP